MLRTCHWVGTRCFIKPRLAFVSIYMHVFTRATEDDHERTTVGGEGRPGNEAVTTPCKLLFPVTRLPSPRKGTAKAFSLLVPNYDGKWKGTKNQGPGWAWLQVFLCRLSQLPWTAQF